MSKISSTSPFYPIEETRVIEESDHAIAFYDKYPVTEGHTLIIPVMQASSIYDLPAVVQSALWELVREVRGILQAKYNPAGYNIGVNDGSVAGQTIAHAHIHIIPRYKGDAPDPRGGIRWVMPEKARYW